MTPTTRNGMGSFVVVSLDQVKQGVAEVRSVLESLGIAVDVVESGRRLRWNTAVVLRIPEPRVPEAMLALGMKGFADVMAYQSGETDSWGCERGEAGSNTVS
jgi:hypothetical protein